MEIKTECDLIIEQNCEAVMRDGTILRADFYLPQSADSVPALLCRTPYNKGRDVYRAVGESMAAHGYGVVFQDVRGRYGSEGNFLPGLFSSNHKDSEDGYDSVE